MSLNLAQIIGRVGQDPEIKDVNGQTLANLSLATDQSYKDKSGNKVEKTEWHRIVVWGKLADVIKQYVNKGDLIYISGELQTRQWDKDGQTHYSTEIRADKMRMLGSKSDKGSNKPAPVTNNEPVQDDTDSDLPF